MNFRVFGSCRNGGGAEHPVGYSTSEMEFDFVSECLLALDIVPVSGGGPRK